MFLHPKPKQDRLPISEKLWIIRHQAENERLSHTKIALDFSSGFEIDLQTLSYGTAGNERKCEARI